MNLIFFGTPGFSLPALEQLANAGCRPALIVTTPDKPRGRGQRVTPTPVKTWAMAHGINVITPAKLDASAIDQIKALKPLVGVLAAYGKIIPKAVIDVFPKGVLNIHPSLLPKYRGASPIQTALLNGETLTGVSIMLLTAGLDEGPTIIQKQVVIQNSENAGQLEARLAVIGAELLVQALPQWLNGQIQAKPQDNSQATFTKPIPKNAGKLDWSQPASVLANMVRAYTPTPGAYTILAIRGKPKWLKILASHAIEINKKTPGTVFELDGLPAVAAMDGALVLDLVQLAGKKPQTGAEFLNGYPITDIHAIVS